MILSPTHAASAKTPMPKPQLKRAIAAAALLTFGAQTISAAADTITSPIGDQSALAVTIYNNNLALVKDERELTIPKGEHDVEFMGVSGLIKPQTALLRSTKHTNSVQVLEQNFDYDLLTPQKLLEKYLGKTVQIVRTHGAGEQPNSVSQTVKDAKVLSTNSGVIVEIDGKIETNPVGHFIFPALPDNLRAQPTLTTTLNHNRSGKDRYELSYLTNGLSWSADYVAELTDDSRLDLSSWVTLNNNSSTDYRNAQIQLVAGDVNQVQQRPEASPMMMKSSRIAEDSASTEDLMEYKLYSLPRKTDIANAQTKQVSLFNATGVSSRQQLVFTPAPINRYAVFQGNQFRDDSVKIKPTVQLMITNDKQSNLGLPLPKGIVRVYKKDSQGNAQFVGEDSLEHTAENEKFTLTLGKSFDVSAVRTATRYKIVNDSNNAFEFDVSYKVVFNNAKNSPAAVVHTEQFHGEWEITNDSATHAKTSASGAQWNITIPAKGETTLSFTARVKGR
ncbi:MAG TPA: DUF4139 domain-containing protein [Marinagarivorans sp.]